MQRLSDILNPRFPLLFDVIHNSWAAFVCSWYAERERRPRFRSSLFFQDFFRLFLVFIHHRLASFFRPPHPHLTVFHQEECPKFPTFLLHVFNIETYDLFELPDDDGSLLRDAFIFCSLLQSNSHFFHRMEADKNGVAQLEQARVAYVAVERAAWHFSCFLNGMWRVGK